MRTYLPWLKLPASVPMLAASPTGNSHLPLAVSVFHPWQRTLSTVASRCTLWRLMAILIMVTAYCRQRSRQTAGEFLSPSILRKNVRFTNTCSRTQLFTHRWRRLSRWPAAVLRFRRCGGGSRRKYLKNIHYHKIFQIHLTLPLLSSLAYPEKQFKT